MPIPVKRVRPLLRRAAIAALVAASAVSCRPASVAPRRSGPAYAQADAIRRDVTYLASDALEGRGTGTAGNDSAAAYIARRYAALGLQPLSPRYLQPFVAHSLAAAHAGHSSGLPTQNVFALLHGSDPALSGEYVVLGAHFDHLGRSTEGALDPGARDAIRHGADDNASGTAAVLELARLLSETPPKRSVLFVNFSGEELGLLGSQYFVEHAPVPLDSVVAMVNFDMVGRLRDDKLIVYGVGTASELPAILDSANAQSAHDGGPWTSALHISAMGDGFGPSDHSSFYARGIPVLYFFTDLHEDYHKATDIASKINAAGEAQVVDVAERAIRAIADRPSRLTFLRSAAPQRVASSGSEGSHVYLGSIPDMGASGVTGVRLTGVTPGSPADEAGLRGGDVIVEFAGRAVKDLYEYSDALYAHRPGDQVTLVVLRNGQRKQLEVRLGTR